MRNISDQWVNRLLAISAVAISAASFYVAVLQTKATQQQVKAETWPYLQIDSSNYDSDSAQAVISYTLVNAGVGPARVESMQLFYDDEPIGGFYELAQRCCLQGMPLADDNAIFSSEFVGKVITANPSPMILPSQSEVNLFSLSKDENNQTFWQRINKVRNELTAEACYCSVLDECWMTDFKGDPQLVKECRADPRLNYQG